LNESLTERKEMLRASHYIIYVDLPGNDEEMLLVHGYTGAYDKVSRRVAAYVRSLESGYQPRPLYGDWSLEPPVEGQVISPSEETTRVLKRRGYLTEKTAEEEEALFTRMAEALRDRDTRRMPNYMLMPAYNCNLCCPYCYQDHMRTDPASQRLLRATMQPELADRIFTAMSKIEATHGILENIQSPRNIKFYGGEPLLEQNYPIIEYIVNKALTLGEINFSAFTNATELHAYRTLLGPNKISFLQTTLDGPPYAHDKRRIRADGSGSFERIAQNIAMALDLGVRVSVRINTDRNNANQLPQLADEIIARGWDRYERFSAYVYPVRAVNKKTDVKTTMTLWKLDRTLAEMRQQHLNVRVIQPPNDGLKDRIWRIFEKRANPIPDFRSSFCGAHIGLYIFDPFGDLYVCTEQTGDPKIRIGYIDQDGGVVLNSETERTWRSRTVTTNPICRKCRYAFYCGGGCAVRALERHNELSKSHCNDFAIRFRTSAAEAYRDFIAGVKPAVQQDEEC
jgi:uncharacterized protein